MDIVDPRIEAYAEACTTPVPEHLRRVWDDTHEWSSAPGMMVGTLEGRFLEMLVFASSPAHVLEIGTFTGYSAIAMAAGLPDGGRITTCEADPRHAEAARRNIEASPHRDRITVVEGRAIDVIPDLDGPFDLVFVDADKESYEAYLEAVLPKLSPCGVMAFDNVLWSGRVLDEADDSASTTAIRRLNERVAGDPSLVCVLLTVRDGVLLVRRA